MSFWPLPSHCQEGQIKTKIKASNQCVTMKISVVWDLIELQLQVGSGIMQATTLACDVALIPLVLPGSCPLFQRKGCIQKMQCVFAIVTSAQSGKKNEV
mmetsp:Transcript_27812/g.57005  ORF Transcript_27812/g.57005 Transcript_27812/m.57005 type:complete len:99 (+) Transcript_27812:342-638(+)